MAPLLCKEARNLLYSDVVFSPVLMYEMARSWLCKRFQDDEETEEREFEDEASHAVHQLPFLLDCVPSKVDVETGPHGNTEYAAEGLAGLTMKAVNENRAATISKLDEADEQALQRMKTRFCASDMDEAVPLRARIYIGRARYIVSGMELFQSSNMAACTNCKRVCHRDCLSLFNSSCCHSLAARQTVFRNSQRLSFCTFALRQTTDYSFHSKRTCGYWEACGGFSLANRVVDAPFCSSTCEIQFANKVERFTCMEDSDFDDSEAELKHSESAKTTTALRNAVKRNQKVARRQKMQRTDVKEEDLPLMQRVHAVVKNMLNVDIGVLHAANAVTASIPLLRGRLVPPLHMSWRAKPEVYGSALDRVRAIYNKHKCKSEPLFVNLIQPPAWANKLKDKAVQIFPAERRKN